MVQLGLVLYLLGPTVIFSVTSQPYVIAITRPIASNLHNTSQKIILKLHLFTKEQNFVCHQHTETENNHLVLLDEEEEEIEVPQKSPTRPGTNIHLWQFVKELLMQQNLYGNYIHWIDRPKGIFKIVDSVKVATLWGKRKVSKQYFLRFIYICFVKKTSK